MAENNKARGEQIYFHKNNIYYICLSQHRDLPHKGKRKTETTETSYLFSIS